MYFIYFLFFILIYYGLLGIFFPKDQKLIFLSIIKTITYKFWGIIIILIGLFLSLSAELFNYPSLIYILTLLFFLEGSLFLFLPKTKINKLIKTWLLLSKNNIRIISCSYLLLAIFLFLLLI